ncbi:branched-chain amino acid ABC transporter permease [Kitasatospora phosalacinea]|uniref:Branched-chain amino acid ABC transporter permease n=1 Tax=Kitasatospora phosalacinea TaxID=2065 RepID=A0ABW6GRR4_9ACTN
MSDAPRRPRTPLRRPAPRTAAAVLLVLVPACLPFYLSQFWLQTGLFAMAAVVAAIGLNVLTGAAGQLSMGHAFFLAVGAYGYTWMAGEPGRSGSVHLSGLGLPPLLAFALAAVLAGAVGGALSPISGRLRGMYLGIATLSLVFLGQYAMAQLTSVTGGYNGRSVTPMEILGLSFSDESPEGLTVLGVPFGAFERLWYFALVVVAAACWTARNLLRGRPGRALGALRDSEVAAAVMGVSPTRHRAAAFAVSSTFAGAAGALLALLFRRVVPEYFGLALSIDYLAMIVIGGLGTVAGAVTGAVLVTLLPQLLAHYADVLPLVGDPSAADTALGPVEAARYLYGAAVLLVLPLAPGGLAGLLRERLARPRRTPATPRTSSTPNTSNTSRTSSTSSKESLG